MIESAVELAKLLSSEDIAFRHRKRFEAAPADVWLEVVEHHPELKTFVIWNKTVPNVVLRMLANDPDDDVRLSVAMKRKLETDVIEQLSLDRCSSVCQSIAYNAKTPHYILEHLTQDDDVVVADAARDALEKRTH